MQQVIQTLPYRLKSVTRVLARGGREPAASLFSWGFVRIRLNGPLPLLLAAIVVLAIAGVVKFVRNRL